MGATNEQRAARTANALVTTALNAFPALESLSLEPNDAGTTAAGWLQDTDGNRWTIAGRLPSGPWTAETPTGTRDHSSRDLHAVLSDVLAGIDPPPAPPAPPPPPPLPAPRQTWTTVLLRAADLRHGDVIQHDGRWLWCAGTYRDGAALVAELGDDITTTEGYRLIEAGDSHGMEPVLLHLLDDLRSTALQVHDAWLLALPYDLYTVQAHDGTLRS